MFSMLMEVAQDFWKNAPLTGLVPDKTFAIIGFVFFALTFWLRTISGKAEENVA